MARLLLAVALLAFSCDAFMVPSAGVALRQPAVASSSPLMMARAPPAKKGAKVAKKVVKKPVKKVAKKVVKKPVKKVVKKVVKKAAPKKAVAKKGAPVKRGQGRDKGIKQGAVGTNIVNNIFSTESWLYRAPTTLNENLGGEGLPVGPLAGVAVWVLLILRYTIFYGFFGTD